MSSGMLRRDISRRFIIIIITSLSAGTHAGRACVGTYTANIVKTGRTDTSRSVLHGHC